MSILKRTIPFIYIFIFLLFYIYYGFLSQTAPHTFLLYRINKLRMEEIGATIRHCAFYGGVRCAMIDD